MKKTSEIATEYKALKEDDYKAFILNADGFINEYKDDERAQIKKYIVSLEKRILAINKEKERMQFMFTFERKYSDYQFVCGVDEVGRGPLAGPVVAGAVILPKDCDLLYLNDSKQLSEKKREELFEKIMESAVATGLGYGSPELIDDINILQADYVAMREAISKLGVKPDVLLNDAVTIPEIDTLQVPIIKGDAKSASIAAASIIAKVTRDKMMVEYAKVFPEYGFDSNKGYGSAKHIEAIKTFGPTPIHRKSFIKNFI